MDLNVKAGLAKANPALTKEYQGEKNRQSRFFSP
jgi:hypothetical protein